jgi:dienelactone hydrolase
MVFATAALAEKPRLLTPPEVWSGYKPDEGPFDEEILGRWSDQGADYKEVYFSAYVDGRTVRVYGIYAVPRGTTRVPAVMHLHGGGQTVNRQWLAAWTARGYACLTCNYHGKWPGRQRYTIFPESLKQGNHNAEYGNPALLMATEPSVRVSLWYLWTALARRSLSYLQSQPGVDRERIGAFGISMGGTTIWPFAMDPRLKAVSAIYGCGWNRYWRDIPKYGPAEKVPEPSDADRVWNGGMEPEAYPPHIHCPVLFLSASNDNHGNMDRAYDTLARLPANVERRQAFTPRFCHHIGADFDQDLPLWMDTWLKGGPPWPQSPAARVSLGADGVPLLTLTADTPREVDRVAVYYAVENPRTVSRNWRDVAVTRAGECWQATLPVMHADKDLFAFANVRYRSGIHLSSNEEAVVPARLGPAKATDRASTVLYDGSDGTGMWTSGSPCTDPVPFGQVPVPIRAATGPGGRLGFTVNPYSTPMTYQPGDPKWQAPAGARLSFDVATVTGETLAVTVEENYFWPGAKSYQAQVAIEGRSGWQTIILGPGNFKENRQGVALTEFQRCDMLQLTGPWKDKNIVFSNFRWVKP